VKACACSLNALLCLSAPLAAGRGRHLSLSHCLTPPACSLPSCQRMRHGEHISEDLHYIQCSNPRCRCGRSLHATADMFASLKACADEPDPAAAAAVGLPEGVSV